MAVSGSREVDIEAPPADVLAVIADLEGLPAWSSIHKKVAVRERDDAGRPLVAEMTVAVMGITDEQVLEFTWTDTSVSWEVVESTQQKSQSARYDLTEDASTETAMVFGELYRNNSEWKFRAVGQGYASGLAGIARDFGVNV